MVVLRPNIVFPKAGEMQTGKNSLFVDKKDTVVLNDVREQFPSAGHLFCAGTLNVSADQSFSRGVQIDYVVEIPLFNPAILERQGNFISRNQLPSKWVLDGASASLIAEKLKAGDEKTLGE